MRTNRAGTELKLPSPAQATIVPPAQETPSPPHVTIVPSSAQFDHITIVSQTQFRNIIKVCANTRKGTRGASACKRFAGIKGSDGHAVENVGACQHRRITEAPSTR